MHWTVGRSFAEFIDVYGLESMPLSVLEIGSMNINGGLRDLAKHNMTWTGLDLEEGPGVDLKIEIGQPFPYANKVFDLVVCSSVFEHDAQFWNTFLEMARVTKPGGLILVIAPSNGAYHRYPIDAFRFYPDAGLAMERWANSRGVPIHLLESFTTFPDKDGWADFISIFSPNPAIKIPTRSLGEILEGENQILAGELVEFTRQNLPYEMRTIQKLQQELYDVIKDLDQAKTEILIMQNSKSWRVTGFLRVLRKILLR